MLSQKQVNYLARHPHAMLEYRATGRVPRTVRPSSPLISLLESLPPGLRAQIRGVRLNPSLGYQCGHQFHTAEQLLRWLKPAHEMLEGETWPAESYRIKQFQRRLSLSDLKRLSSSWPSDSTFHHFRVKPVE
jgi:hypothetical protein